MTKKEQADALLDQFEGMLPSAPALSYPADGQPGPDDALELLVFASLLTAAKRLGVDTRWRTRAGDWDPDVLRFHRGPGEIWGNDDITHAVLAHQFRPFARIWREAHVGTYIAGASGRHHEADVLLIPHKEGQAARRNSTRPRPGRAVLVAEAKLYGGRLPFGHARELLGLGREVDNLERMFLCSNQGHEGSDQLLSYWFEDGGFFGDLPDDGAHNEQLETLIDEFESTLGRMQW